MWTNDGNDPMFQFPTDAVDDLITWTLDTYPPTMAPGSNHRYSNFGYCLLGRIIERATDESYEQYVQGSVLAQCGIIGMQLAGDTLAERASGEATYDGANSTASVTFFGDAILPCWTTRTTSRSVAWTRTAAGSPPPRTCCDSWCAWMPSPIRLTWWEARRLPP